MCFESGVEQSSRNAEKANEFSSQAIKRSGVGHEKAGREGYKLGKARKKGKK